MLILIGVDVVLGPLLTLVVFNPAKKSLRIDLAVIAALQVAALVYGISVIAQARPAYVVFAGDRFTVIGRERRSIPSRCARAKPPYDTLPLDGPKIVGARDARERRGAREGAMLLTARPRPAVAAALLRAFRRRRRRTSRRRRSRSPRSRSASPTRRTSIDKAIARAACRATSLSWVPVVGRLEMGVALVDTARGEVVAVVPVDPY